MMQHQEQQPHLLVFGPGFSASGLIEQARAAGWRVTATWRRPETREALVRAGVSPVGFSTGAFRDTLELSTVSHILVSVAPGPEGDPVLSEFRDWLERRYTGLGWIGYLSSTNVYGNHDGAWVDETSETRPGLARGQRRLAAEQAWTMLGEKTGAAVHIFRLAGIYGPGRNAIRSVLDGKARRVIKPGQVFGRIHRDDIAAAVWLAARSGLDSTVFNLADDLPAPPQDVITEAARLLGMEPPPEVAIEDADLSPMARSFYEESKRVGNRKAKEMLGWKPAYPDYRQALAKMLAAETAGENSRAG